MRAKPTPGPWIVSDTVNEIDGADVRSFRVSTADGRVIMDALNSDLIEITSDGPDDIDDYTRHFDWQSLANARLMAAAPEMLEALQRVVTCKTLPEPQREEIRRVIVRATTRDPLLD